MWGAKINEHSLTKKSIEPPIWILCVAQSFFTSYLLKFGVLQEINQDRWDGNPARNQFDHIDSQG